MQTGKDRVLFGVVSKFEKSLEMMFFSLNLKLGHKEGIKNVESRLRFK